ncbi:MAG: hypothetical protein HQL57_02290 [Magnetococcales bacterium]|nr:hypothetical protein [Magnetococcales bacterium]MBF0155995.1 hypothetical protein [Magnetococcales bacterium]
MAMDGGVIRADELLARCLDEVWWQEWLAAQEGAAVESGGSALSLHETDFVEVVEGMLAWLLHPGNRQASGRVVTELHLWGLLFRRWGRERLRRLLADPRQVPQALQLSRAWRNWCRRQFFLRQRTDWFREWRDLYPGPTLLARPGLLTGDGRPLAVRGRWQTLRRHPSHGLEVVGVTTGAVAAGEPGQRTLLSLALHARLLRTLDPETPLIGTIEEYGPELSVTGYSEAELVTLFEARIAPQVAAMAGESIVAAEARSSP